MADKLITEFQLRSLVSADLNFVADDGIQTYRITAAQLKDFVLSNGVITEAMLAALSVSTGKLAAGAVTDAKTNFTPPTRQTFVTGSGTYTTPAGVKYIRVRLVGGGGGGGGGGNGSGNSGNAGGTTTFGTSLLSATGGAGGSTGNPGGYGGIGTINSPAFGDVFRGNGGGPGIGSGVSYPPSGAGGSSMFSGAGPGNVNGAGIAGQDGSGSGGSGGSANNSSNNTSGSGGAGGGGVDAVIVNPSATYSYAVGGGGSAGGATSASGYAGGAGGKGRIIVDEFYQ